MTKRMFLGVLAILILVFVVVAPASAEPLEEIVRVSGESNYDSVDGKTATATCPPGMLVAGAGYSIDHDAELVDINSFYPLDDLSGVTVQAFEDGSVTSSWSIKALATCIHPLPNQNLVTATDSDQFTILTSPFTFVSIGRMATATCASGQVPIGGGVDILTPGDAAVVDNVVYTALGVQVAAITDGAVIDDSISVRAYAVCADPPEGYSLTSGTSAENSSSSKAATADCPHGTSVLGAGFNSQNAGHTSASRLMPQINRQRVKAVGQTTAFISSDWALDVIAVCASVDQSLDLPNPSGEPLS